MEVKETDYDWLAGIVDGEGSIYISKTKVQENLRGFQFKAQMSIWKPNEDLIRHVHQIAGVGSVFRCKENREDWKDKFAFMINSGGIRELIPKLLPYLVLKKQLAVKMLEFLTYMRAGKRGEYSERVYQLYHEIKVLSRKGKQARLILQVQD